jgi:uncharacterized SAM-binding protein YcdF (DUF218 family)
MSGMDDPAVHELIPGRDGFRETIGSSQKFRESDQRPAVGRIGWIGCGQRFLPGIECRFGPAGPDQKIQVLNRPMSPLRNQAENSAGKAHLVIGRLPPTEFENRHCIKTQGVEIQNAPDHWPGLVRLSVAVVVIRKGPGGLELMVDFGCATQKTLGFGVVSTKFLPEPECHQHRRVEGIHARGSQQVFVDCRRRIVVVAPVDRRLGQQTGVVRLKANRPLERIERTGVRQPVGPGDADGTPGGESAKSDYQNTAKQCGKSFEAQLPSLTRDAARKKPTIPSTRRLRSNIRVLFVLRKLIEAMLMPLGISGFLIIAGIASRRRSIAVCGVVALWVFSTPMVGNLMLQRLERTYESKSVDASPDADAIVVLSGSVVRGITAPGVQWGDSANRYFAGFDLAMAGKAKFLVFSGAASEDPHGLSQGAILRQTAVGHGIRPERVILTGRVLTTEDEARAVSQIPDIHSILLVTSAFHMPRAVLLFRARGLDVSPFPTDERVLGRKLSLFGLIPSSGALRNAEEALREYYGLAVYRILLFSQPLGRLKR